MTSLALLPNLMGPDGLMIFVIILLFFGAKRLPELAKGLGSAVREFSKAKDEIEHEITRPPVQPPAPQIEAARETQPYQPAAVAATAPAGSPVVPPAGLATPAPLSPLPPETQPAAPERHA